MPNDLFQQFLDECALARIQPEAAVVAGGLHRTTWFRWKKGVSPNLKNLQSAGEGVRKLSREAA